MIARILARFRKKSPEFGFTVDASLSEQAKMARLVVYMVKSGYLAVDSSRSRWSIGEQCPVADWPWTGELVQFLNGLPNCWNETKS